jgi:hypothetical protein
MKRKLILVLLVLAVSVIPARADGPVCGTTSNPSRACSAPAPPTLTPSLSLQDVALAVLAFIL